MGDLGSGHCPCAEVGENHSWSPATNVADRMGVRSAKGTVRTRPILYKRGLFKGMPYRPYSSVLPFFLFHMC